jgi:hypothetical protein
MRRWLLVGLLGLGLVMSACAGPGQPPTTADLLFPLPDLLKTHGSGTSAPAQSAPEVRP